MEVKILRGRSPLLVAWENPAKSIVESLLVTCECQGLKLDGYTREHSERSQDASDSDLHVNMMASNLAYALELSDIVTSTSLDHLDSLANHLSLSDKLVTSKGDLEQNKRLTKRSRRESKKTHERTDDDGAALSSHSSQDESTLVDNQTVNLGKRRKKRRLIKVEMKKKKQVDPRREEESASRSNFQLNNDPAELSQNGNAETSLVGEDAAESKILDAIGESMAVGDSGTEDNAEIDQVGQIEVTSPNAPQMMQEMSQVIPPEAESAVAPKTSPEILPETLPQALPETRPSISPKTPLEVPPETQPLVTPDTPLEVQPETQPVIPPDTLPEVQPETQPEVPPEISPEVPPEVPPEAPPEVSLDAPPEAPSEIPLEVPLETKDPYIVVIDTETEVVVSPALLSTNSVSSYLPSEEVVTSVISEMIQPQDTSATQHHSSCVGMATEPSEGDVATSLTSSEMGTLSTSVRTHDDIRNLAMVRDTAKVKVIRNLTEEERKTMFQFRSDCEKKNRHELERSGTKAYLCEQCGKVLSHGTRTRHLKTHMADRARNNVCEICGKGFHSREGLKHHQEVHDEKRTFDCRYCPRKYKTMYGRTRHERLHFAIQAEKCKTCGEKFKDLADLKNHLQSVHKMESFERTAMSGRGRGRPSHLQMLHAGPADTTNCGICNKVVRKSTLPGHLQRHEGRMFTCPLCGKVMAELSKYSHMRLHTGQKDYKCTYCSKAFFNGPALKVHMRTHTGERPIKCRYCERGFSRHSSRDVHEASHTGERPFKCTICDKSWKDRSSYGTHMKKNHPGEPLVYKRLSARINSQHGKLSTHVEVIDVNQVLEK